MLVSCLCVKVDKEMIGKLLRSEQTNSALVVALSGTVMVLMAKGNGPLSPSRLLARVLPDPVARYQQKAGQLSRTPVAAPSSRIAG